MRVSYTSELVMSHKLIPSTFERRGSCRDRQRRWWACVRLGSRAPTRERATELQTTQCVHGQPWYIHSLVRVARVQRRQCVWCEPPRNHGNMELDACSRFWWNCLVSPRLSLGAQVHHGRLLLRNYRWSGGRYSSFRLHPTMGSCHHGHRQWCSLQLCN